MKKNEKGTFNIAKLYRQIALVIYDVISIIAASYLAILMRYEFHVDNIPDHFLSPVNMFLPINIIITLLIFYLFRLYK